MKKSKKGFTLMELLAVIVVIAIIALIATPLIYNLVQNSRKEAFRLSVTQASKAVEYYLRDNNLDMLPEDGVEVIKLPAKNNLVSGNYFYEGDKLFAGYVTDNVYCAYGPIDELKIAKECKELDVTAPIIDETKMILSSTSNTITVTLFEGFAIDNESGIKEYQISLYNGSTLIGEPIITDSLGVYVFDGLTLNTKYEVKVTVINQKNLSSKLEDECTTSDIAKPIYKVSYPLDWTVEKTIEIIYDTTDSNYIKEYSLDGKNWEGYVDTIIFTKPGTICAKISDGTNYVESSCITITKIDTTAPENVDFTYETTSNTIKIKASGVDEESGIYGYRFSIDGGTWTDISDNNVYLFENVKTGVYDVKIRVINNTLSKNGEKEILFTEVNKKVIIEPIPTPTYKVTPTGWAQSKTVEITYKEGYKNEYSLDGRNTWKKYTEKLTYTSNQNIIARISDGTNEVEAPVQIVNQIDTTAPENVDFTYETTSNTIKITASGVDEESGIYGYRFSIDGGTTWTDIKKNNVYTYEKVKAGTYNVMVRVINNTYGNNKENLKSYKNSEIKSVIIEKIEAPTYKVTPTGWSQSKTVEITYKEGYTNEYSLDGGITWKPYTGKITFTQNGTIIARINDGTNYVKGSTQTIAQIDTEVPSATVSEISDTWAKSDKVTITLNDSESGVVGYAVTENKNTPTTWTEFDAIKSTSVNYTATKNGTYYVHVKDATGRTSYTEFDIIHVDTTAPNIVVKTYNVNDSNTILQQKTNANTVIDEWKNYGYRFVIEASDSESALDTYTWEWNVTGKNTLDKTLSEDRKKEITIDGMKNITYQPTLTGSGIRYGKITFKDTAGNSRSVTVTVYIDKTVPTVTVSNIATTWGTSDTVTLALKDTLSGVVGYTVTNNTDTPTTWTEIDAVTSKSVNYKTTKNGTYYAHVKDLVGKTAYKEFKIAYVDTTPPSIDFTYATTSNTIKITATGEDKESGIYGYRFSMDGGKTWTDIKTSNVYTYEKVKTGSYNLMVRAINGTYSSTGENTSSYKNSEVKPARVSPIEAPTYKTTPSGDVWAQSKTVEITYASGYTNEYSIDGGITWNPYTAPVKFTADGNIIARVSDGTNYVESSSHAVTKIDTTAPTKSTFSYTRTSKSITVVATGEDLQSGIAGYRFSSDGGSTWTSIQASNSYTFNNLTTGSYKIRVRVINGTYKNSGENTKSYLNSSTQTIATTTINKPTYKVSPDGWATSKTVEITYPSGYTKEYSIDGGTTWKSYTAPVVFTAEGSIIARVTDGKNIVEGTTQTVSQIDTKPPICTWSGESTTWRKSATITATCDDQGQSGCTETSKSWSYSSTTKTATLTYTFTDAVGNSAECSKKANVYVDTTKPSINIKVYNENDTSTLIQEKTNANVSITTWKNYGYNFVVVDSDSDSGLKNFKWEWNVEGKTTLDTTLSSDRVTTVDEKGAASATHQPGFSAEGIRYGKITVTDKAGNSRSITVTVYIDKTKPTCDWSGESTTWRNSATIKATCKDTGGSGCSSTTTSKSWGYTTGTATTKTATLSYTVTDGAGNSYTCSKSANVYVDRTPPSATSSEVRKASSTGTLITDSGTDKWRNYNVWWGKFSATDTGGSGIDHYEYSIDCIDKKGNLQTEYTYKDGKNSYYCIRAVDGVGNEGPWSSSYYFRIDTQKPNAPTSEVRKGSSTGDLITDASTNKWRNYNVWWGNYSATDNGNSGIKGYEYSTDCDQHSAPLTKTYTYKDGIDYAFCIRSIDNAGNQSAWSTKYYFKVDTQAPNPPTSEVRKGSSTGTLITDASTNKWRNYNVWFGNFSATDNGKSGIDHYEHSSNCETKSANLKTEYLYESGVNYNFCIRSVDKAGNPSEWTTRYYFKVDTDAPGLPTSEIRKNNSSGDLIDKLTSTEWKNHNIWWGNFSATDTGGSGINHFEYTTDCGNANAAKGGNLNTNDGHTYKNGIKYTFCIRSVDNASNPSAWSDPYYFKVDTSAPQIVVETYNVDDTSTVLQEKTNANTSITTWKNYGYKFVITNTDSYSGLAEYKWEWNASGKTTLDTTLSSDRVSTVNENGAASATHSPTLTGAGIRYAKITATDKVGNSRSATVTVYIDKTKPTCDWSGESTSWRNSATIKATCKDTGGSGCSSTTTSKSWGYTTGTATTKTATLSYTVTDVAGNSYTCSKSANVYVDRTPPGLPSSEIRYLNSTGTIRTNSDSWSNKNLWWGNFNAPDSGSGIDHYEYLEKCDETTTAKTLKSSYTYTNGKNSYYCIRAVDKVGNVGAWDENPYYFKVDTEGPTCEWSGESTSWRNSATIKATCKDTGGSGCTTTSKSWDYTTGTTTTKTATLSYTFKDGAGNSNTCSKSANVYVDRTPPSLPSSEIRYLTPSGAIRTNIDSWSNKNLWWGNFSATDSNGSGIDRYEYIEKCDKTTTAKTLQESYTYTHGKNSYYCIRAVDKVGNVGAWDENPYYFKVDTCNSLTSSTSYGAWSGWSACSATCGAGTQTRTRTKTVKTSSTLGSGLCNSTSTSTETESQACTGTGSCNCGFSAALKRTYNSTSKTYTITITFTPTGSGCSFTNIEELGTTQKLNGNIYPKFNCGVEVVNGTPTPLQCDTLPSQYTFTTKTSNQYVYTISGIKNTLVDNDQMVVWLRFRATFNNGNTTGVEYKIDDCYACDPNSDTRCLSTVIDYYQWNLCS